MYKAIATLALVVMLTGCVTIKTTSPDWQEVSWSAFCAANGYDTADNSTEVVNEYLDTWRGSQAEDAAFEAAGVEPC